MTFSKQLKVSLSYFRDLRKLDLTKRYVHDPKFPTTCKWLVLFGYISAVNDLDLEQSLNMVTQKNQSFCNSPYHFLNARFVDKHEAMRELGIKETALKTMRNGSRAQGKEPVLIEGVHWCKPLGSKTCGVLYNVSLIKDLMCNPNSHYQAVEAFLATMPSSMAVAR